MLGSTSLTWRPVNSTGALVFLVCGMTTAGLASLNATKPIANLDEKSPAISLVEPASLTKPIPVPRLVQPTPLAVPAIPLPRKPLKQPTRVIADVVQADVSPSGINDLLLLLESETPDPNATAPKAEDPALPIEVEPTLAEETEIDEEPSLTDFLSGLDLSEIDVEEPDPEPEIKKEEPVELPLPALTDLGLSKPKASPPAKLSSLDVNVAVSNQAGAGDSSWNGRFPWTAKAPILAKNGLPIANPLTTSPIQATVAKNDEIPADGSIPRSFIMSAASEVQPVEIPKPAAPTIDQKTLVANYGGQVSSLIQQNIKYPKTLLAENVTGTVELGLIFNLEGEVSRVVMIKSSDNQIIDDSAVATVRSIKFPIPPAGSQPQQLRFGIKMTYTPPPSG